LIILKLIAGGFNDYTIVDDLHPDEYTLRFIDDKNNDYNLDKGGKEMRLKYIIPCIRG